MFEPGQGWDSSSPRLMQTSSGGCLSCPFPVWEAEVHDGLAGIVRYERRPLAVRAGPDSRSRALCPVALRMVTFL